MRTELTYAVDAMARYHGDFSPALEHVADYWKLGGLSDAYYHKVVTFMYHIRQINAGGGSYLPVRWRRRLVKAMRKQMPRVHTEAMMLHENYLAGLMDAREFAVEGRYFEAKTALMYAAYDRRHGALNITKTGTR